MADEEEKNRKIENAKKMVRVTLGQFLFFFSSFLLK